MSGVPASEADPSGFNPTGPNWPGANPFGSAASVVGSTRARARRLLGWSVLLLLGGLLAVGYLVKVDEVALVPGAVRDTEPLVAIDGAESYPSEGEILYTTIRLRQNVSLIEYFFLKLDDDAELLPAEEVLGDRTPEQNRELNLDLMTDSKQIAVAVALEALGYDLIGSDGVVVADVLPGSAADGFLEVGDTIVAVDGEPMPTALDLIELLAADEPGVELAFDVEHFDGTADLIKVAMGARDDDPTVAFLGIVPLDRVFLSDDRPFDVEIDSGSVGGPSAGLAFTLGIIDKATDGDLSGGGRIAVTGTIAFDGQVGPIGGAPQKAAAVRDLGIEHFIVPEALGPEELALVRERAGADVTIHPVRTLDEALAVLAGLGGDVDAIADYASQHE